MDWEYFWRLFGRLFTRRVRIDVPHKVNVKVK